MLFVTHSFLFIYIYVYIYTYIKISLSLLKYRKIEVKNNNYNNKIFYIIIQMYLTSAVYGWTVVSFCFSSLFFSFWPPFSVSAGFKPSLNSAKTGFFITGHESKKIFFSILFYFVFFLLCFK